MNTLAGLISGIVAGKSTNLPHIASRVPDSTEPGSRVKRFSRWVDNPNINSETFFSDQKSRGFHLDKSHLSAPERLARLIMGACLAYIWIIYLGVLALHEEWRKFVHRTDRCDLGLFQLGLRLLDYVLNEGKKRNGKPPLEHLGIEDENVRWPAQ